MKMDWDSEVTFTMRNGVVHAHVTSDAFDSIDDFIEQAEDYLRWYLQQNLELIEDEAVRAYVKDLPVQEDLLDQKDHESPLEISFSLFRRDGSWVPPRPEKEEPLTKLGQALQDEMRRGSTLTAEEATAEYAAFTKRRAEAKARGEPILLSTLGVTGS